MDLNEMKRFLFFNTGISNLSIPSATNKTNSAKLAVAVGSLTHHRKLKSSDLTYLAFYTQPLFTFTYDEVRPNISWTQQILQTKQKIDYATYNVTCKQLMEEAEALLTCSI